MLQYIISHSLGYMLICAGPYGLQLCLTHAEQHIATIAVLLAEEPCDFYLNVMLYETHSCNIFARKFI